MFQLAGDDQQVAGTPSREFWTLLIHRDGREPESGDRPEEILVIDCGE